MDMATQYEQDEAAIRGKIETLIEGLHGKDLDQLRELYAPDVVSFDVEPPLQHVGVAAKLRNWEKVFAAFHDLRYELRDLTFTVGDGVAYGHGFGRIAGTLASGAVTNGMWVRATLCLRKVDGSWLITHDQASVPLDMSTGKGATDLEP